MHQHKCDLHIHSTFSDGKFSIAQLVDIYGKNGYSIIAVTDHLCGQNHFFGQASHQLGYSLNTASLNQYMETIRREALRAQNQYGMMLLPGYEITKNYFANRRSAHFLVIGIEDYSDPDSSTEEILHKAKQKGALTIAAHPFHTGDFEFQSFYLWNRREALRDLIDAWEFNYRTKTVSEVLNSGLPIIANSDLHHERHFNSWRSAFHGEKSLKSLTHSIKEKKLHFFRENLNCDYVTNAYVSN